MQPALLASDAGATLTPLPDDSILAGGVCPAVDTYTVEAVTSLAGITGVRLETIPDPSMPHHGCGRDFSSGNFHLGAIRLGASTKPEDDSLVRVHLRQACADFTDPRGGMGASAALSTRTRTPSGPFGRKRSGVTGPSSKPANPSARVPARGCGSSWNAGRTPRRAYWAASDCRSRIAALRSSNRACSRSRPTWSGMASCGSGRPTACWATGNPPRPSSSGPPHTRAPARSAGSYWPVAHHHVGRHKEAQSDCNRALERRRTEPADDVTDPVGVEGARDDSGPGELRRAGDPN